MAARHRRVLLTGAGGGLGSAMAKRLADDGYDLVLTDQVSCRDLIKEISTSQATHAEFSCDLSDSREIDSLLDRIEREVGHIDILINNAAVLGATLYKDLARERLELFLNVNVLAPFHLAQRLAPSMANRGWGRIINIVTSSAWGPHPGFTAYISSKMALVGMTRSLAVEMGDQGITVNAITPGLTWHDKRKSSIPESIWEHQRQRQAIHRTGRPEDLVGAIAFLCSDDSAFMTGQTMFVDGGDVMI